MSQIEKFIKKLRHDLAGAIVLDQVDEKNNRLKFLTDRLDDFLMFSAKDGPVKTRRKKAAQTDEVVKLLCILWPEFIPSTKAKALKTRHPGTSDSWMRLLSFLKRYFNASHIDINSVVMRSASRKLLLEFHFKGETSLSSLAWPIKDLLIRQADQLGLKKLKSDLKKSSLKSPFKVSLPTLTAL